MAGLVPANLLGGGVVDEEVGPKYRVSRQGITFLYFFSSHYVAGRSGVSCSTSDVSPSTIFIKRLQVDLSVRCIVPAVACCKYSLDKYCILRGGTLVSRLFFSVD